MGLDGGKGNNGYHITKELAELIVFFLLNYACIVWMMIVTRKKFLQIKISCILL